MSAITIQDNYISVAAAAQQVGLSSAAVYKAIRVGLLSPIQHLGRLGLDRDEVQQWYGSRRKGRLPKHHPRLRPNA